MRFAGRIEPWNDDKGFGFVTPHGGSTRAFVHVKAFPPGSRRPAEGDFISYEVVTDSRGRANATRARFADQRIEPAKMREPRRLPRALLGGLVLAAVAVSTALGIVPPVVALAYGAFAFLSWVAYARDKDAAGKGERRTPESTLHLLDLLGGWPGALVAQQRFRHKTSKGSFQAMFWLTVVANVATIAWLMRSGMAHSASKALFAP